MVMEMGGPGRGPTNNRSAVVLLKSLWGDDWFARKVQLLQTKRVLANTPALLVPGLASVSVAK